VAFGKFHALLIANEEYALLPDLVTPKEDVDAIDSILRDRYGFTTTVIKDGSREVIMDNMYKLLGELTSEDNLLIYYAGHGEYVTDTNRGVWLPVDANPTSPANWITNIEVSDYLKQIAAKQIVVIVGVVVRHPDGSVCPTALPPADKDPILFAVGGDDVGRAVVIEVSDVHFISAIAHIFGPCSPEGAVAIAGFEADFVSRPAGGDEIEIAAAVDVANS
jgi:hypothetical protein